MKWDHADERFGLWNPQQAERLFPECPLEGAPPFRWPIPPAKQISWLPHYFLPRNAGPRQPPNAQSKQRMMAVGWNIEQGVDIEINQDLTRQPMGTKHVDLTNGFGQQVARIL